MAQPRHYSEPTQLLAFVLCPDSSWKPSLIERLTRAFGELRHSGGLYPFDRTSYYTPEMGDGLYRGVLSFSTLIEPCEIGAYKRLANELEQEMSTHQEMRSINIDVGYMDTDKIVLPSFKRGPFKLYAGDGLWLDMLLTYAKGAFHPTAWAFEDFARNPYQHDLLLIREKYKKDLKNKMRKTNSIDS